MPPATVYILPLRALSDLIVLDLVCAQQGWPDPLAGLQIDGQLERRRFAFLARPAGPTRRNTMHTYSKRLMRLTASSAASSSDVQLLPVQVFWGQAPHRQHSFISNLLSESWAATSRLRRFISLLASRHHIVVRLGAPLALADAVRSDVALDDSRAAVRRGEDNADIDTPQAAVEMGGDNAHRRFRRCSRLLRVRLHGLRAATLGPDLSHRRTLVDAVARSHPVQSAINESLAQASPANAGAKGWGHRAGALLKPGAKTGRQAAAMSRPSSTDRVRKRLQARAHKAALAIASDMSYPFIVCLARVLTAFLNRVYDEMRLNGLDQITDLAQTHTLVYVPSHRSHMDYLLLSLLLFNRGLTIPHIAAGDNLNLPLLGGLLRRCGAFFMRRSFRDDPIYAAAFSEYLYAVYWRGHAVEFFPEGGRSRSGRLMPARLGLLGMTLDHAKRRLPRPIAFVPVYLGYERLIEGAAYVDELRGAQKRRESFRDVLRGLRLLRQRHGRVDVNIGQPLRLDEWRQSRRSTGPAPAQALGRELLERINRAASVNPVNIAATTLLCAPRVAMEATPLKEQIDCCLELLRLDVAQYRFLVTNMNGGEIVDYVTRLGLLTRRREEFGDTISADGATAVLLTWYRNNTAHALALPSLLAFLMQARRRPIGRRRLGRMAATVFPYAAWELHVQGNPADIDRWIGHLTTAGLLLEENGLLRPPAADCAAHHRLRLLANIIRQTLERQYIVLSLLTRSSAPAPTRAELRAHSQRIAHKMARLHGINAPEFFDHRLFDVFIDKLIIDGVVAEGKDGRLSHSSLVDEVLRTANRLIDAELRYAVLRE